MIRKITHQIWHGSRCVHAEVTQVKRKEWHINLVDKTGKIPGKFFIVGGDLARANRKAKEELSAHIFALNAAKLEDPRVGKVVLAGHSLGYPWVGQHVENWTDVRPFMVGEQTAHNRIILQLRAGDFYGN